MTTAYAYIRSSTKEEVEQGSNERQINAIKDYCKLRNYDIRIFEDKGISGKNINRKAYQDMLNNIDNCDLVIVYKIDRLARSLIDLLNFINLLDNKNKGFVSIADTGIDTTNPNGKLLIQILGAFAEFERNIINERTRKGREFARERGRKFGRPELRIDKSKVLELHSKGLSARAISKAMNCSITPILRILKKS
jgi:DNA invertase Pin-like site-specific DNA recombinase